MQRVLVVGGAGLIGSHLVDRLLADGNEVIAIDDLSGGSFANVAHLKHERRFAFIEHDVVVPFRAEVSSVFHLAVPSTRMACESDPVKAAMTCVTGTVNALEVAAASGARVVLTTAVERWGDGMRCAESLAADYAKRRGVDIRLVRLPRAYGPRMAADGDHVVTALVLKALRAAAVTPRVRLQERLRLAYIDDVVETLARTMSSVQHTPPIVAASLEASVVEIAQMIADAAGLHDLGDVMPNATADATAPPSLPFSTRPSVADALPAAMALGLVESVGLAEGLARTVRWFESRTCHGRPRRPGERRAA